MKKRKFNSKLLLRKNIVVKLNSNELANVLGKEGVPRTEFCNVRTTDHNTIDETFTCNTWYCDTLNECATYTCDTYAVCSDNTNCNALNTAGC